MNSELHSSHIGYLLVGMFAIGVLSIGFTLLLFIAEQYTA